MFKFIILLMFIPHFCFADTCIDWFKESKISKDDKACISKCTTLQMDMSTFSCSQECEKFCNTECAHDIYWKSKIKDGRPEKWEPPTEKPTSWTNQEKEKLQAVLGQLPDVFKKFAFKGFYRMQRSGAIGNPGSIAESGQEIVVYNIAFDGPGLSLDKIIAHELAHAIFLNFSKREIKDYERSLGWNVVSKGQARSGPFISTGARENVDEDFANNVEYFLFAPEDLKSKVPKAYSWILNKFSKNFKLKEACEYEKK